jgi:hypothetical protein
MQFAVPIMYLELSFIQIKVFFFAENYDLKRNQNIYESGTDCNNLVFHFYVLLTVHFDITV